MQSNDFLFDLANISYKKALIVAHSLYDCASFCYFKPSEKAKTVCARGLPVRAVSASFWANICVFGGFSIFL